MTSVSLREAGDRPGGGSVAAELLAPALRRLCWIALVLAYLWALPTMATFHRLPDWPNLVGPATLIATAALAIRRSASYRTAALTLVMGSAAAVAVELAVGHGGTAGLMALAAVLIAGVFVGTSASLVAAAALSLLPVLGWLARPDLLPLPLLLPVVREAALGGVLLWAVGGSIFHAIRWAEATELRSWHQVREATEGRAELQRTSKALRDMYAALERTNRELEVARREAGEAKEAKSHFAANISHELRTPLNLILGFSRMMYQTPEVYGPFTWPADLRLDIHEVYRASRHLLGMVDDILDLSRLQAQRLPLRPALADLGPVIEEAAATARGLLRGKDVAIRVSVPADLPPLLMDATRVRQILLNLLSNAIRFTDTGEIAIAARLSQGEVEVCVSDTGAGIPAADLPTIFEEFTQAGGPTARNQGGAGLGLAVCKHFVQLHGGRIVAESQVGKGSTFRFTLPLPDSGRARSRLQYYAPEGWSAPMPANRLGQSLLVLAQDAETAQMVARGIEGYRTVPVTAEEMDPTLVRAEHPLAIVVVRDPMQPGEHPTAESIWQAAGRQDLPVIECEVPTGNSARLHLGVDAYLTKPVQAEELLAAVGTAAADGHTPGTEGDHRRFLVVDDAAGFRTLMRRELLRAFPGASVQECADGDEGLARLRRERFDLLLLDLVMPGTGGLDMLRRAQAEGLLGETRVIVTSGAPYIEDLSGLWPTHLRYSKNTPPRSQEWFRCITALAGAAPPDYTKGNGQ
ncbi:MAG: ATP-binding protein [Anaerolineae bacterium]